MRRALSVKHMQSIRKAKKQKFQQRLQLFWANFYYIYQFPHFPIVHNFHFNCSRTIFMLHKKYKSLSYPVLHLPVLPPEAKVISFFCDLSEFIYA
jgi:hypothetical protein